MRALGGSAKSTLSKRRYWISFRLCDFSGAGRVAPKIYCTLGENQRLISGLYRISGPHLFRLEGWAEATYDFVHAMRKEIRSGA
jgi:hypothetical protein